MDAKWHMNTSDYVIFNVYFTGFYAINICCHSVKS